MFVFLAVLGLGFGIFFLTMLIKPFLSPKWEYDSNVKEKTIMIPKKGRYAINSKLHISNFNFKQSKFLDTAPKRIIYSVTDIDSGEQVKYVPYNNPFLVVLSFPYSVYQVGYFDIEKPGNYLITSMPESDFIENEKILIRKHLSMIEFFALIWGIFLGVAMFIISLTIGFLV